MSATAEAPATTEASSRLSLREIQGLVKDLKEPKPWVYWTDFLATIIAGHIAFHLIYFLPLWMPGAQVAAWTLCAVLYVATVVLYLRAAMFIHELVHLKADTFRAFRIVWNALCGIFFLIPSFMYYPHVDHHRRVHYGTEDDGEYLPLSHRPVWWILGFVGQSLILPILGYIRFLIISPICWIVPGARRWVHRHASTMVVDPFYKRPEPGKRIKRIIFLQEFLCFAWLVWFTIRGYVMRDVLIDPFWIEAYLVGVGVVGLNGLRTLGAHRWLGQGEKMSFEQQLLDSVNFPDHPWCTELWGPVGTRYHALHHLLPGLPYHNLGEAHRRLMRHLPPDSPYRATNCPTLTEAIRQLWHRAAVRQQDASRRLAV